MAKKQRPGAPKDRALQYEDLDPEGKRAAREQWQEMGKVATRHSEAVAAARQGATSENPQYAKKMGHRESSLGTIGPHLQDKPMSLRTASAARVRYAQAGRERARAAGGGDLGGSDWFFTHHNLIREAGREHGFPARQAITATTNLSPLNSPETERKAGRASMRLAAEPHTVHITKDLHAATAGPIKKMKGPSMPTSYIGKEMKVEDLHPTHVAAIGSVNARMRNKGKPIQTSAPGAFTDLGATRLSEEVGRSVAHLRGDIPEEQVISPHGGPKVWSYKKSTQEAVPGSAEHGEFTTRLHHWIHGDPNQGVLNLWGLRHSEQGILSSGREPDTAHTPEDTWMQAISTRQTPANVGGRGRGVSVAKVAGSDPKLAAADAMRKSSPSGATVADDPRIGGTAINHALNNKATRMASQSLKIQMGGETANMPARALHPMAWTEIRRQADKDPEYKAQIAQMSADHRKQVGNQRQLFGESGQPSPQAQLPKKYRSA